MVKLTIRIPQLSAFLFTMEVGHFHYIRGMNKQQKMQLTLGILFVVLLIIWLVLPGNIYSRIPGVISSALGILSMVLSYRAEEKNKNK